ncbi:MAG: SEC-C metal-binding domain-containing protein, partial [Oceanicaulis sp.]
RIDFMTSEDVSDVIKDMRADCVDNLVERHIPPKAYADQWDVEGLDEAVKKYFSLDLPIKDWAAEEGIADEEIKERLQKAADEAYAEKAADIGPELMRRIEKQLLLQTIDTNWRDHLQQLDALRSVVGLRGYAQRDPLNEFKTEAFSLFEHLLDELRLETTRVLFNMRLAPSRQAPAMPEPPKDMQARHTDPVTGRNEMADNPDAGASARPASPLATRQATANINPNDPATWGRVQRNAPCPCGSGKKYKHCHGAVSAA